MKTYYVIAKRIMSPKSGGPRDKFYLWNETGEDIKDARQKANESLTIKFPDDKIELLAAFENSGHRITGVALDPRFSIAQYRPQTHTWTLDDFASWTWVCANCGKKSTPETGRTPQDTELCSQLSFC